MQLPDFSVQGRVALLTGAARGIALELARTLAAGGASVVLHDLALDIAKAEADAINRAGGRAHAIGGDATDLSIAEGLIAQTVEAFGSIDILVNSVSIQTWQSFFDHGVEQLQKEVSANLLLPTRLCQLAIPLMRAKKWGRVINFSSIQGKNGNDWMPVYAMSRAGMSNLTKALARRFGPDGITVNCIAPGWMDTLRTRESLEGPGVKEKNGRRIPLQRIGEADDCNGLCLLLCSKAGSYITGETIYVDGGISI